MTTNKSNDNDTSSDFTPYVTGVITPTTGAFIPCSPSYKVSPHKGRTFKTTTQTVPDQAYTVREIFERSVLNSDVPCKHHPAFYSDNQNEDYLLSLEGIDPATLDLVELKELQNRLNLRVSEYKRKSDELQALYDRKKEELVGQQTLKLE